MAVRHVAAAGVKSKKLEECSVLCLDTCPSMSLLPGTGGHGIPHSQIPGGGKALGDLSPLQAAISVARHVIQQMIVEGGRRLIGLVLFGTQDKTGEVNSGDHYQNISVVQEPAKPSLNLLHYVHSKIEPGAVSASFTHALAVSVQQVIKASRSAKCAEKVIYLITDCRSVFVEGGLKGIGDMLKREKITLIVVGPDFKSALIKPSRGGKEGFQLNQCLTPAEEALSVLLKDVQGISVPFSEAADTAVFIHKTGKMGRAQFSGMLEIGSNLKIPCNVYTKVKQNSLKWKELSARIQALPLNPTEQLNEEVQTQPFGPDEETEMSVEAGHLDPSIDSYEDVSQEVKGLASSQIEPDVSSDERKKRMKKEMTFGTSNKGFKFKGKVFKITEDQIKNSKPKTTRCLSVLGFTAMANIKDHQFLGDSIRAVVAKPGDEHAGKAIDAFIQAMFESKIAGVARYVIRNGTQPRLVALLPLIEPDNKCLLMFQLPFKDDMYNQPFPSFTQAKPDAHLYIEAQLEAVDGLITAMDLMQTAEVNEQEQFCEALHPEYTLSPFLQTAYECINERALSSELTDFRKNVLSLMTPSESMLGRCNLQFQRIKDLFFEDRKREREEEASSSDLAPPLKKTKIVPEVMIEEGTKVGTCERTSSGEHEEPGESQSVVPDVVVEKSGHRLDTGDELGREVTGESQSVVPVDEEKSDLDTGDELGREVTGESQSVVPVVEEKSDLDIGDELGREVTGESQSVVPVVEEKSDLDTGGELGGELSEESQSIVPFVFIEKFDLVFGDKLGGEVYKARWNSRNMTVALKRLTGELEDGEASKLESLRHRNIIRFYGVVIQKPEYWMITEYAENGSLFEFLQRNQVDLERDLKWAMEIAQGLHYLHHDAPESTIHGDLKSSNVVLTSKWTAKICDFGSARKYYRTTTKTIQGTYPWMAPEVIKEEQASISCDIFSYGMVLWELLTHLKPFNGFGCFKVATMIVNGERPSIPENCPLYLENLMKQCLEHDPKARPRSSDILLALQRGDTESEGAQHPLNPHDLAFFVEHLQPCANVWKKLGLQLGLQSAELKSIESMPVLIPDGPAAFLQEMMDTWLNQAPPSHPFPTITKLCNALRSCTVRQERVAYEIEQQYKAQSSGGKTESMSSTLQET